MYLTKDTVLASLAALNAEFFIAACGMFFCSHFLSAISDACNLCKRTDTLCSGDKT
jgi:hypothetical protein